MKYENKYCSSENYIIIHPFISLNIGVTSCLFVTHTPTRSAECMTGITTGNN